RRLKGALFAAFMGLAFAVPVATAQTPPRLVSPAAADLSGLIEAATRAAGPSVVEIFTTSYIGGEGVVPSSADLVARQRASGSGVIVDPDGYIVTNAHVVRGAQRIRVEIPIPAAGQSILATSSRTASGEIIGIDLETDLAVIKVNGPKL